MNIKFKPPQDGVEFNTICRVEQLYQNLILKNPTKVAQIIESITANINLAKSKKIEDAIGKDLFFQYDTDLNFTIFDKSFTLPAILGIFNSRLKALEKISEKKSKLIFSGESGNKKAYIVVLCFANYDELNAYKKGKNECWASDLENAKFPQEYL